MARILVGVCRFTSRLLSEFKTLEIQQTFYQPPARESTVVGWRNKAPADFHWCFKVFQGITHPASSPTWRRYRRGLSESEKPLVGNLQLNDLTKQFWQEMVRIAKILDAKVMVVQTPASFRPTEENIRNAIASFRFAEELLKKEGLTTVIGFEPRGEWLSRPEAVKRVLAECERVIHVVDPFFHEPVETRGVAYFRLHGKPYLNYRYRYTDDDLRELARKLSDVPSETIYVMFNNVYMVDDAKRFANILSV